MDASWKLEMIYLLLLMILSDFGFEKRILTHEMWESASNGTLECIDVLFCGKDKKWMHYSLLFVLIFKFAMKQ